MADTAVRLVAFARYPVAGQCKTRLIPAIGAGRAAAVHKRLVENCIAAMRETGLPCELRITGAPLDAFADWLGHDIAYVDQGQGDLGDRLSRAGPPYPVIIIGSDCPDLDGARLTAAAKMLAVRDAVIGPAEDGGYYLLGLKRAAPWLFTDMPWGTDSVCGETVTRFAARGVTPKMLEPLADLDRPEDLPRWPWLETS